MNVNELLPWHFALCLINTFVICKNADDLFQLSSTFTNWFHEQPYISDDSFLIPISELGYVFIPFWPQFSDWGCCYRGRTWPSWTSPPGGAWGGGRGSGGADRCTGSCGADASSVVWGRWSVGHASGRLSRSVCWHCLYTKRATDTVKKPCYFTKFCLCNNIDWQFNGKITFCS